MLGFSVCGLYGIGLGPRATSMPVIKGCRWTGKVSAAFPVCLLIFIIKMIVAKYMKAKKMLRKFI